LNCDIKKLDYNKKQTFMEKTAHHYETRSKNLNKSDHKPTPEKIKNKEVSPSLAQTDE